MTEVDTVRQPTWYHYVGVLTLAGVGYVIALATSSHTPRLTNEQAPDRVSMPSPPVPLGEPQLVNTPQEEAIVRGLYPNSESDRLILPRSAEEKQQYRQRVEQRKRAAEEAGGNSPSAFPLYLRLLTAKSRLWRDWDARVMRKVAEIPGDRTAFRQPAVDRLNDPDLNLAKEAMKLLVQIGTAEDVPAVVERFVTIEYDDRVVPRDHAYFAEGLKILAKFGGEAEIATLDQAKAEHLLSGDDKFWAKAEECKTAIRERLAKEKAEKK